MIIKAKPTPFIFIKWTAMLLVWFFRRRFNKMVLNDIDVKPDHSYLLMSNHFSFLDAFFSFYIILNSLAKQQDIKGIYVMSLKKQMEKKWYLKYFGSFSVEPGTRSIDESLAYAATLLGTPGNVLIYYPQGNLESSHIRKIEIKDGVYEIAARVKNNCQLIWSSNLIEYFESIKPSVYMSMLDCGTAHHFDFQTLTENINMHHRQSIKKLARFTEEDYTAG